MGGHVWLGLHLGRDLRGRGWQGRLHWCSRVREVRFQCHALHCHCRLVHLPPGLLLRLSLRCRRSLRAQPHLQLGGFREQDRILLGHLACRQGGDPRSRQTGEGVVGCEGCVKGVSVYFPAPFFSCPALPWHTTYSVGQVCVQVRRAPIFVPYFLSA